MFEPLLRKASMTRASGAGRAARLLYIEDTPSNLEVVKLAIDYLRPTWQLLAALDGHSGLRQAREERPDLVLLNLHLPGHERGRGPRQPAPTARDFPHPCGDGQWRRCAANPVNACSRSAQTISCPNHSAVNVLVDKLDHLLQIGCGVPTHRATEQLPVKAFFPILGVVLIIICVVWFLQGINVLPGSFMTGQTKWAIIAQSASLSASHCWSAES